MNGEARSQEAGDRRPASGVEEGSGRDFGLRTADFRYWNFSVPGLLLFAFCFFRGVGLAQDEVPVPPLEEGALFIFHPIAVHFAIALTCFGCVLDWLGSVREQSVWQQAGKICFFAGVVALGFTALSGWIEHELPRPPGAFDAQAQNLFFYHEYGGYALVGFFLVLAIFRSGIQERLPLFFVLLSGVGLLGLLVQGYLGGELVYRYGAGVRAVQILTTRVPELGQKKASKEASEAANE
jgi:uncharacterized membrane protein